MDADFDVLILGGGVVSLAEADILAHETLSARAGDFYVLIFWSFKKIVLASVTMQSARA
jgi:L-2-hydroxyglutarate oxidase LhgO